MVYVPGTASVTEVSLSGAIIAYWTISYATAIATASGIISLGTSGTTAVGVSTATATPTILQQAAGYWGMPRIGVSV
jgi:hypothetical protein